MPRNFLDRVFREMFGDTINGAVPDPELAFAAGAGMRTGVQRTAQAFASLAPVVRACAIASIHTYRGRFFASLREQFDVSQTAMGIQLLQMGLVK